MRLVLGRAGLADNGKRLTSEIIQEVVETFAEVKEAPVTIGHTYADYMPAFGWVKKVWTDEDNSLLLGEVELIPPLKEFFQEGYFRKWSVGIRKRPKDGKHYLHHLAFLGAVPPAIKGLSVIKMSEEGETEMYEFADTVRFVSQAKTDWPVAEGEVAWDAEAAKKRLVEKGGYRLLAQCCGAVELLSKEDKLPEALSRYHFPFCDVIAGKVKIVPKAVSSALSYLHGARRVSVRKELAQVVKPVFEKLKKYMEKEMEMGDVEALKKENTALKAKIEELEKKLSQAKSERKEFAELKDELKLLQTKFAETAKQLKQERLQRLRAAAEGKLPKEALKQLLVFAERLPEEPLVFAEGEKKEKKDPLEWLAEILAALPKPVAEGALQMGDVKDKEEFDPAKMAQIL